MKAINHLLLILLVLIGFDRTSDAQTLIPRVGATFSTLTLDFDAEPFTQNDELKMKSGFVVGLGIEFILSEQLVVLPELTFVQKGFRSESNYSEPGYEYMGKTNLTVNYLELPVLIKYMITNGSTRFFVMAGPSLGFGLGGKLKDETSGKFENDPDANYVNKNDYDVSFDGLPQGYEGPLYEYIDNRLDIGMQAGVGALIADKIIVEVRYGLAFTKLYDDRSFTSFGQANEARNRVIQFSVGVPLHVFTR
jgi:hypothetical protein